MVSKFNFDGNGPPIYWWISHGNRLAPDGLRLLNEYGSDEPLTKYDTLTVVIELPANYTIYDFDWFGLWCEVFHIDYGHAKIPKTFRVFINY